MAWQKYLLLHSQQESIREQLGQLRRPPTGAEPVTAEGSSTATLPSVPPARTTPPTFDVPSDQYIGSDSHAAAHRHVRHVSLPSPRDSHGTKPAGHDRSQDERVAQPGPGHVQSHRPPPSILKRTRTFVPAPQKRVVFSAENQLPRSDSDSALEVIHSEKELSNLNGGIKRSLTELLNSDRVRDDKVLRMWVQSRLMDAERELRAGRRRRTSERVASSLGHAPQVH